MRAAAEDWPGWRGLDRQGAAPGPAVISLATNRNVRWRVAIPGQGHSSPIVVGDAVLVTTAYPAKAGEWVKHAATCGSLSLAVLLGVAGLAAACLQAAARQRPPWRRHLRMLLFLALAGSVIALLFGAQRSLTTQEVGHSIRLFRWLFSSVLGCLGVMAAVTGVRADSRARLAAGLALILFSGLLAGARPNKDYYGAFSGAAHTRRAILVATALPASAGLVVLAAFALRLALRRIRRRRAAGTACDEAPPPRPAGGAGRGRIGTAARLLAAAGSFGAGLAAFGIPRLLHNSDRVRAGVYGLLQSARSDPMAFVAASLGTGLLCVLIWVIGDVLLAGTRTALRLPRLLRLAPPAVALIAFADLNYLGVVPVLTRAVLCMDRESGSTRWVAEGLKGPHVPVSRDNSPATPTPVSDGTRVYAYFGTPGVLCVNMKGEVLWTNRDLPFEGVHGVAASPVLCGARLIILSDMPGAPYLTALDTQTGERVWTANRAPWKGHGCHCTPTAVTLGGQPALIVRGWWDVTAYAAQSGAVLWQIGVPGKQSGERVASVLVDGDRLYVPNEDQVSALSLAAIAKGDPTPVWTTNMKRRGPNTASPVLRHGLLFMVSDHGYVFCLDTETGKVVWRSRFRGTHYASPLATDEAVYLCGNTGRVTVVACSREYRKLAENDLFEPMFASPALADDRLFIRTKAHLWCFAPE
ncbi:MAG: PQQ-like beta-propeller repeat protein [Kiritimatiellae bacterium]|nr:PQQ-like beta-propeller repeat protein [Kiritimatiellia bacterium]